MKSKIRAKPKMPNCVGKEIEERILRFCFQYPTYGPERIEAELKFLGISVGHTGIYNVLKRRSLNIAKNRLECVRKLSGEVVTQDEITRDKEMSKTNHVEANYPGQLVSQDTFYIGCLKGIGRIYHQVACDCFSSFGVAKIYDNKTADASADFVENHLTRKFVPVKIERLLTDCGTEFTTWHQEAIENHEFEKTCKRPGINHTTTKVKHPWTNGYVERLNKTLLDEFYSVAFRKKQYKSVEELQIDVDNFMDYYNYRRTHQGYKLKENGYKIPGQAHFQKNLTKTKECEKIKKNRRNNEQKGGGKILNFAFYPVKLEVEKREVLAYKSVNTS